MSDDALAKLLEVTSQMTLSPPRKEVFPPKAVRDNWLETVSSNFVAKGESNRSYYMAVLTYLWPEGSGIPGPHRTEDELRKVIEATRPGKPPYRDPFRRIREMQGEEGLVGIVHVGKKLQLISLGIAPKRIPRTGLKQQLWDKVLARDGHACTVCGSDGGGAELQQDHRVPRLRGGSDELENWQPLCGECNNHKSTMCRGCDQKCQICPWAFPEKNGLIRITPENTVLARQLARSASKDVHELVNGLLGPVLNAIKK